MFAFPFYLFLVATALPCLVIVLETWFKAFMAGVAILCGHKPQIEIVTANYVAKLLS